MFVNAFLTSQQSYMMSLSKTIYIGAVVFIMAASTAGLGAKRKRSDATSDRGAGESAENNNCGRYTPDFFKMGTNLAGITWAHAVNNKDLLDNALTDKKVMMLEADVVIGTCEKPIPPITSNKACETAILQENIPKLLPVMGHPPATTSDLSLESLLADMISHNDEGKPGGPKGLKLDFKTIEAFEASLPIIGEYYSKVGFPLWLNADILPGPGENNDRVPVDAQRFLEGASSFPASKLSLGWTTKYCKDYGDSPPMSAPSTVAYSKQHVTEMLTLMSTNVSNRNVTFPVRAGIAANCSELMLLLLHERPTYTLTIWSAEKDFVDTVKLNSLLQQAGNDRFYLDVPKSVADKLKCRKKPRSAGRLLANIGVASAALVAIALFYFNKISME